MFMKFLSYMYESYGTLWEAECKLESDCVNLRCGSGGLSWLELRLTVALRNAGEPLETYVCSSTRQDYLTLLDGRRTTFVLKRVRELFANFSSFESRMGVDVAPPCRTPH
jgi:hypothetical protein